jgi:hypothetical protein
MRELNNLSYSQCLLFIRASIAGGWYLVKYPARYMALQFKIICF